MIILQVVYDLHAAIRRTNLKGLKAILKSLPAHFEMLQFFSDK
jgi:hypothetical protein